MPIERVPVVHKFGIISKSHQEHLKQQKKNEGPSSRKHIVPRPSKSGHGREAVEEIVFQLQSETEDLLIFQLEESAKSIIQKIKFKINSVDNKDGLDILTSCWKDLCSLGQSRNTRIVEDSLRLLQESLEVSPLSKHMVQSLLDLAITYLQCLVLLENDNVVTKNHSNNVLVVKTSFVIFSRLYYHCKAGDLPKVSHQLEALYLINKGLNKTLSLYEEKPIIWAYLSIIHSIVFYISSKVGEKLDQSCHEKPDVSHPKSMEAKEFDQDCAVEIPRFLWNTLKIWKSITRKVKLPQSVLDEICSEDLSMVNTAVSNWFDYVMAFYILAECAKLKTEFLFLYLQLGPKNLKTNLVKSCHKHSSKQHWNLQLQVMYLRCLSDIAVCGLTSDIITLALFGNDVHNGLVDYFDGTENQDNNWMIQQTAHQYLHNVYTYHKQDNLKDCVTNMIWNSMRKFQERQSDVRILEINKFDEKVSSCRHENNVFTKIATNFSIMFLPMESSPSRKTTDSKKAKDSSKISPGKNKEHVNYKHVTSRVDTHQQNTLKTPSELKSWSHMQEIISTQFSDEKKEDDVELEKIQEELEKLDLVFKPEYDGPSICDL